MAGLGWQELVIVLVIIMIIFGAGKLPEIAKSLGQGVKEFREEAQAPVGPGATQTTGTATESTLRSDADSVRVVTAEETVDATGEAVRVEEVRAAPSSRDAI
jgi:sec-independent protein translocase protein TatA